MTAPETQMAAHQARRAGATKPKAIKTRGSELQTNPEPPWGWASRFARPPWFDEPAPEILAAARPGLSAGGLRNSRGFGRGAKHGNVAVAALAAVLFTAAAWAGEIPTRPDPALTPGVIRGGSTDRTEICQPGYSRAHRVWRGKADTLRKYGLVPRSGLDPGQDDETEDDDLVPVCLGGDNADPRNHWPQGLLQAYRKDMREWRICRAVCEDRISLPVAQHYFQNGQWLKDIGP